jgi:hypothetical protein
MQEQHAKCAAQIDIIVGVLGKEQGRNGDVPRMFRRVFVPAAVDQQCLTERVFEPVDFEQKCDLPFEPVVMIGDQSGIHYLVLSIFSSGHYPSFFLQVNQGASF